MRNNRVSTLIILAFILGFIALILLRLYAVSNMNELLRGNEKLSAELRAGNYLRTVDHNLLVTENRIRAAIATNDTSHLNGIDEKTTELRRYLDSLKGGSNDPKYLKDLDQLAKRANEKLVAAHQLEYLFLKTGKLNDTSFIANPKARIVSEEITSITGNIYDKRQKVMTDLSHQISENGRIAAWVGNVFLVMVLISSCLLCWFIISQFNKQNRLIAQLDISEKKAQDALQIKENFLANMSHEIRTPLNSIVGFTNLLKKQELNTISKEFVQSIQGAGENLMAIINDILDLSKIEAGMMRIVHHPFSVRALMHSIETLFSEKVKEKKLSLSYHIDTAVPDTLLGDATRLTQILINLIGNAIKFSERGKIKIQISGILSNKNTILLAVTISDEGIGIEKEKLNLIFDRFNQAEEYITRNYGGTGLGLSIVKNLIILQQGNITVKSEPGKGTEFSFSIPYTVADEQLSPVIDQTQETNYNDINPLLKILVVDDNTMNQGLMRHLLLQWKASFEIVSNGLDAIDQLKLKEYNLILMDIQMPKMDGYTATHFIRNELKLDIPIVAMTAHAMAGEREKCLSYGMNDYIAKPINEDNLFAIISRLIEPAPQQENSLKLPVISAYQYIDLTYMKDISKGNTGYEKKVTSQFIDSIPADLKGIQEAYQRQDFIKLNAIAHNMKTSVSIMGLLPLLKTQLDTVEFSAAESPAVSLAISELNLICKHAVAESMHFFNTLQ